MTTNILNHYITMKHDLKVCSYFLSLKQKVIMKDPKDPTTDKLSLVQPNKVTNAKYDYTAVQENVLTCIIEAIQDHLTQKKPIQTDLFGHPSVKIHAGNVAKGHTKYYVLQQLRDLRKKDIDFSYTDQENQLREVTTGLINTFQNIKDTDLIEVEISTWAIPYLLYWGKGVGGTIFQKVLALRLKSIYAKRLYKLCCRWQDQGGFTISIAELREMFGLENKYERLTNFRYRVLNPAKDELKQKGDLYFEYELQKIKSRSYNHIAFKIFSQKTEPNENVNEWYQFVYSFICRTYPSYQNDKAMRLTDKLAEDPSVLRQVYNKFARIDDQFTKGQKEKEDVIKLTKHILKNDFNLKL